MVAVQINDLARVLGVHRNTIRNWISGGKLPPRARPGKRYILTDENWDRLSRDFGLDSDSLKVTFIGGPDRDAGDPTTRVRPGGGGPGPGLISDPVDICQGCGSCAAACPISGVDGLDPRKAVRMIVLGHEQRLIDSRWPWLCTLCGRCAQACPMNIDLTAVFRAARSLRERDKAPGPLHKGVAMCLRRGNNMGISRTDFRTLVTRLTREMGDGGTNSFRPPLNRKGARLMVTVNSKEPFADQAAMVQWWRIFQAAGEDWTVPAANWEGVNWALFTGDEGAMKTIVGRVVDNMLSLGCRTLLLPD